MATDFAKAGSDGTAKAAPGVVAEKVPRAEFVGQAASEAEAESVVKAPGEALGAPASAEAELALEPVPKARAGLRETGVVGMRGAPRPRRVVALADVEAAVAACGTVQPSDRSPCLAAELTRRGYQVEVGPMEPVELAGAVALEAVAAETR